MSYLYEKNPLKREITDHAFESDTTLREVVLPDGLESVGRFAFLKCINLRTLELTDSVQIFADTALRQCDALSLIRVHMNRGDARVLSGLLAAVEKEITLELIYPDGKAVLLFPDYNYVYTEHTMSRAFLFNIDGCGMAYRECVDFNGVNYREYDKLFEKEKDEDPHAAPFLALNRLMYPYRLSQVAKTTYEAFFKEGSYLNHSLNPNNSNPPDNEAIFDNASNHFSSSINSVRLTKDFTPNNTTDTPLSSGTVSTAGETVSGVASYAAGDGVFLLSAENRDERPDFLKELILQNDMPRLTFLSKEKLLSKPAAELLLEYTDVSRDNYHSSQNQISNAAGKSTHIRALLMDYLRELNPKANDSGKLTL